MSDLDPLLRAIDEVESAHLRNDRERQQFQELTNKLATSEIRVESPDGVVSVTAGPGGLVKSVRFSDRINRVDADSLSVTVTQLLAQARAEVAAEQQRCVTELLGDDRVLLEARESSRSIFGAAPAESPAQVSAVRYSEPDDDAETSIFQDNPW